MITVNGVEIKPLIFPDKTSQVFRLPEECFVEPVVVEWEFENEAEIMHVLQTVMLLSESCIKSPLLMIERLPYDRQDKPISNTTTFAKYSMLQILKIIRGYCTNIRVIDEHSQWENTHQLPYENINPSCYIADVIKNCEPDFIAFPDKGASQRGYTTEGLPSFSLDKKRNQETGEIEGLKCELPLDLRGKSVLLLDDLLDFGGTFIKASKLLKEMGAENVYLYVTHGLFNGGTKIIFDAGIDRIFTYKGEVHNG